MILKNLSPSKIFLKMGHDVIFSNARFTGNETRSEARKKVFKKHLENTFLCIPDRLRLTLFFAPYKTYFFQNFYKSRNQGTTGKQLSKCLSCQNVGFCKFGSRPKVFTCLMLKRCSTLKKVFILHSLKSRTRGGQFCRFWST